MFKNLSLRNQLFLPLIITLVGLIIIAAIFFIGTNKNIENQQDYLGVRESLSLTQELERLMLEARTEEKDFILHGDLEDSEKHILTIRNIDALIETFETRLSDSDYAEQISDLKNNINTYATAFNETVSTFQQVGLSEKSGLQGEARNAVRSIEDLLKQSNSDTLTVTMLMMRRHEKDFLLRFDPKYVGRLATRFEEFQAQLAGTSFSADEKQKLIDAMTTYKQTFDAMAAGWITLREQISNLEGISNTTQESVKALESSLNEYAAAKRLETQSTATTITYSLFGAIGIAGLLMVIVTGLIAQGLRALLSAVGDTMKTISGGDLETEVFGLNREDEIGNMAKALEVFRNNAVENIRLTEANEKAKLEQLRAEEEQRKREAELQREEAENQERALKQQTEKTNRMNDIIQNFDAKVSKAMETLISSSSQMKNASSEMKRQSEESGSLAETVNSRSNMMSGNVNSVASATEELSASILEISRQIQKSNTVTKQAVDDTHRGTNYAKDLSEAGQKIETVVDLIQDIANQTNLLALNATIEAARAGEAGKGFAVVASEVKSLATQTSKATEEISGQIHEMQNATNLVVAVLSEISEIVDSVSNISTEISAAMEEQSAATNEISGSVQQAADAAQNVASSVSTIKNNATDTREISVTVEQTATNLEDVTTEFQGEIDNFLKDVRAV
ncbi:methyl-accepting chemotaxis protein [Sneathiella aquimaris]|uniref:methyl-accepting chemotaxis protein n=1 Tax=Sneathiella aquimaris TaxID=2599305 RepID=UPI00146E7DA7|nr:methyl-accepting chemotaxis protein [Sneathiella aquimaris]